MGLVTVGQRVSANNVLGTVRYTGETKFAQGYWIGIELDSSTGKNDGSVQGERYFSCAHNCGVFVRPSRVVIIADKLHVSSRTSSGLEEAAGAPSPGLCESQESLKSLKRSRLTSIVSAIPSEGTDHRDQTINYQRDAAVSPQRLAVTVNKDARDSSETIRPSSKARVLTSRPLERMPNLQKSPIKRQEGLLEGSAIPESPGLQIMPSSVSRVANLPMASQNIQDISEKIECHTKPNKRVSQMNNADVDLQPSELVGLKTRITSLEIQRSSDIKRLSSLSALESEKQAWGSIKSKLRDKLQAQQSEITNLRNRLKAQEVVLAQAQEERSREALGDISEMLEMATLDREMAEEERDQLKVELEEFRSRTEELSLELDIMREQVHVDQSTLSSSDGSALKLQNERLREALLRLKEITVEQEKQLKTSNTDAERLAGQFEDLKQEHIAISAKLAETENLVEDLRGQIDISIGVEEMLESLTDRNLILGEQLEKYRAEISDLEALRNISNEIEDAYVQDHKALQEELRLKESLILEQIKKLASNEKSMEEYAATIRKFRDLVATMQAQIDTYSKQDADMRTQSSELSKEAQSLLRQNVSLGRKERKNQIRKLELELAKAEASEALERLEVLEHYISDSYSLDKPSLESYFQIRRIKDLALIMKNVMESEASADGIDEVPRVALAEGSIVLAEISMNISRLCFLIRYATSSQFSYLSELLSTTEPVLSVLQVTIDSLKDETFNESIALRRLSESQAIVEKLNEHWRLDSSESVQSTIVEGNLSLCETILRSANALILFIDLQSEANPTTSTSHISSALKGLQSKLTSIRSTCSTMMTSPKYLAGTLIKTTNDTIRDIKVLHSMICRLSTSENSSHSTEILIQVDRAKEHFEAINSEAQIRSNQATRLSLEIAWKFRATDLKSLRHVDEETQRRLETSAEQLEEMRTQMRQKDKVLEEEHLRVQSLTKRFMEQHTTVARVGELELGREKAQEEKMLYEEAIEELNSQMFAMEKELKDLRDRSSLNPATQLQHHQMDSRKAEVEVKMLKSTIRYLKEQNVKLRNSPAATSFLTRTLLPKVQRRTETHNGESEKIYKALRQFVASAELIDLSRTPIALLKWQKREDQCAWRHYKQEEDYIRLLEAGKRPAIKAIG